MAWERISILLFFTYIQFVYIFARESVKHNLMRVDKASVGLVSGRSTSTSESLLRILSE